MIKSKTYIETETGIPIFLLMTSGGISIPPVEALHLITSPIAVPIITPPNKAANNGSLVIFVYPIVCSKTLKMSGK